MDQTISAVAAELVICGVPKLDRPNTPHAGAPGASWWIHHPEPEPGEPAVILGILGSRCSLPLFGDHTGRYQILALGNEAGVVYRTELVDCIGTTMATLEFWPGLTVAKYILFKIAKPWAEEELK